MLIGPHEVEPLDPWELAALLGVELTDAPPAPKPKAKPKNKFGGAAGPVDDDEGEPFRLTRHPQVRAALAKVTDDRSVDTNRVVGACYDAGLTLANARWAVQQRKDLAGRLDERTDDDVARVWERVSNEDKEADDTEAFTQDVDAEMRRLRVRETARLRFASEKEGLAPPFDAGLLDEILARPEEDSYRIQGVLPSQSSMLVVAQRKTGKTTLMLNLARSLLTAEPFLGTFAVRPPAESGRVAILNYEVSGASWDAGPSRRISPRTGCCWLTSGGDGTRWRTPTTVPSSWTCCEATRSNR